MADDIIGNGIDEMKGIGEGQGTEEREGTENEEKRERKQWKGRQKDSIEPERVGTTFRHFLPIQVFFF